MTRYDFLEFISDFEQCLNRLQLYLFSFLGQYSAARKQILFGGAIRPRGLLL